MQTGTRRDAQRQRLGEQGCPRARAPCPAPRGPLLLPSRMFPRAERGPPANATPGPQPRRNHHESESGCCQPWSHTWDPAPRPTQGPRGGQGRPTPGPLTFQNMKLTGSTTVGWMISRPGKMPQVTALGCSSGALVMFSPWAAVRGWLGRLGVQAAVVLSPGVHAAPPHPGSAALCHSPCGPKPRGHPGLFLRPMLQSAPHPGALLASSCVQPRVSPGQASMLLHQACPDPALLTVSTGTCPNKTWSPPPSCPWGKTQIRGSTGRPLDLAPLTPGPHSDPIWQQCLCMLSAFPRMPFSSLSLKTQAMEFPLWNSGNESD